MINQELSSAYKTFLQTSLRDGLQSDIDRGEGVNPHNNQSYADPDLKESFRETLKNIYLNEEAEALNPDGSLGDLVTKAKGLPGRGLAAIRKGTKGILAAGNAKLAGTAATSTAKATAGWIGSAGKVGSVAKIGGGILSAGIGAVTSGASEMEDNEKKGIKGFHAGANVAVRAAGGGVGGGVGATIGGIAGSLLGPLGTIAGMAAGGWIGAKVGDYVGDAATNVFDPAKKPATVDAKTDSDDSDDTDERVKVGAGANNNRSFTGPNRIGDYGVGNKQNVTIGRDDNSQIMSGFGNNTPDGEGISIGRMRGVAKQKIVTGAGTKVKEQEFDS